MMTGGVSKNQGLVKTLEEKLGTTLVISDKAQLCGALGAALFAMDMVKINKIRRYKNKNYKLYPKMSFQI